MKICTLDLETTGLIPKNARYETDSEKFPYILSMAWCVVEQEYDPNLHIKSVLKYEYIINQEGRTVPIEATKINGITQEMCDASKFNTFTTLLQFMMDADGSDLIVGHNIYFDTSIIKANVLRIISGGKTPMEMFNKMTAILHKDKRIDTMRLCHKLFGGKWPTLEEAYFKLFGKTFKAHSAGNDVDAAYRIYLELEKRGLIPKTVVVMEEE